MEKRSENALREKMQPMIEQIVKLFESAMILRVDVHLNLAFDAGAEAEDIPEIVAGAVESAMPLVHEFFNSLAEVSKANAFKKPEGR